MSFYRVRTFAEAITMGPLVDILGTSSAPVTLATTYGAGTTSGRVDGKNAKYAVFYAHIVTLNSTTALNIKVEASHNGGAGDAEWMSLTTDDISSGVATTSPYESQIAVSAVGLVWSAAIPIRGYRWLRLQIKCVGTPAATAWVQAQVGGV